MLIGVMQMFRYIKRQCGKLPIFRYGCLGEIALDTNGIGKPSPIFWTIIFPQLGNCPGDCPTLFPSYLASIQGR